MATAELEGQRKRKKKVCISPAASVGSETAGVSRLWFESLFSALRRAPNTSGHTQSRAAAREGAAPARQWVYSEVGEHSQEAKPKLCIIGFLSQVFKALSFLTPSPLIMSTSNGRF